MLSNDLDPTSKTWWQIMVAEDDPASREILRITLANPSWHVDFCEDGDQAIDYCSKCMPDLAILDIRMPGHDGMEVCQYIKSTCGKQFVPVILLTASRNFGKVEGLGCGADEYLLKPFIPSELIAHIQAFLRIKMLTDELARTQAALVEKERELVATQLAGAAAHELGQPLTQMMLACEHLASIQHNEITLSPTIDTLQHLCRQMRDILMRMRSISGCRTKPYLGKERILAGLGPNS